MNRLSEAPPGAPGPPAVLSYEEAVVHVHAEPAESYEEELMDDLQDRMELVDAGSMNSMELAEYCALLLRGEHDSHYCCKAGEAAFAQVAPPSLPARRRNQIGRAGMHDSQPKSRNSFRLGAKS